MPLNRTGLSSRGTCWIGLRRQLVDRDRVPKAILGTGEQKSLQTDRVILIPGPDSEISVVREVYELFTKTGHLERQIAEILNARGVVTDLGHPWTRGTVHQLLTNPKYIGSNVFNRRSFKLKQKRVKNPSDLWIRRDSAFEAIIPLDRFVRAQEIIQARHYRLRDEEMLLQLRRLWERVGSLSGFLIDEDDNMASSSAFRSRFKTLHRAYSLIGYKPERDFSYIEVNQRLREHHRELCDGIVSQLRSHGALVESRLRGMLLINEQFTASLVLARCQESRGGSNRWRVRLDTSELPDITIAARLRPGNAEVLDFYLLPSLDRLSQKLALFAENPFSLDVYRFDSLDFFLSLSRRRVLWETA